MSAGSPEHLRQRARPIRLQPDGVYAEYITSPSRNLVHLPDNVDFAAASVLSCAGMTAVHAARLSNISVGETAVVNGISGVGSMVLQVVALVGTRVLAVADTDEKLELAESYGAAGGLVVLMRKDTTNSPTGSENSPGEEAPTFSSNWSVQPRPCWRVCAR